MNSLFSTTEEGIIIPDKGLHVINYYITPTIIGLGWCSPEKAEQYIMPMDDITHTTLETNGKSPIKLFLSSKFAIQCQPDYISTEQLWITDDFDDNIQRIIIKAQIAMLICGTRKCSVKCKNDEIEILYDQIYAEKIKQKIISWIPHYYL